MYTSNDLARGFIRSKPQPTRAEALQFSCQVMTNREHRLFYGVADTLDCESALAALKDQAMDLSEYMAIAMLEYAMEGDAVGSANDE
ncbi:hypothetical protein [Insolitispirillum peregrinum]|uniref:hypothetical protein n=1 Tax=Insolitispirillum peregrinum TaxID=80876 RepID=UPI0036070D42